MPTCPNDQVARVAPAITAFIGSLSCITSNEELLTFYTKTFIHHLMRATTHDYYQILLDLICWVHGDNNVQIGIILPTRSSSDCMMSVEVSEFKNLDKCWQHDKQSCMQWDWPLGRDVTGGERSKWKAVMDSLLK